MRKPCPVKERHIFCRELFRGDIGEVEVIRLAFPIKHSHQAEGLFKLRCVAFGTIDLERPVFLGLLGLRGPAFKGDLNLEVDHLPLFAGGVYP